MSTVNRNGGLGGLWPKPNRRDANGAESARNAGQAPASKASDKASFSHGTSRLTDLAGDVAKALAATGPASSLVREAKSLPDLIEKALSRSLGRPVNLGAHRDTLAQYVKATLEREGYPSFDDLKQKVG